MADDRARNIVPAIVILDAVVAWAEIRRTAEAPTPTGDLPTHNRNHEAVGDVVTNSDMPALSGVVSVATRRSWERVPARRCVSIHATIHRPAICDTAEARPPF